MDSTEHAKRTSGSPKAPSPDLQGRQSTHSARPSQAPSQGPMMSIAAAPSPQDAQMDKKFKFVMIGSIVMDFLNLIWSVIAAAVYYAAVNRRKRLWDGKYDEDDVYTDKGIAEDKVCTKWEDDMYQDCKLENVRLRGTTAMDSAKAGMPIACILALVCAACLAIDAFCCFVVQSLRNPKGPMALLGWLAGTGVFILFTMIQVIVLIVVLTNHPFYIYPGDYKDYAKEAEKYMKDTSHSDKDKINYKQTQQNKFELMYCYPAIVIGFIVVIGKAFAAVLILGLKKGLRGAAAGPVPGMPPPSVTPSKTATGATSPTGTATTQGTGSPA